MTEAEENKDEKTIPFYPHQVLTEARVSIGILLVAIIVGAIGLMAPVGQGDPADPMITPAHTKPEWYFLSLYQILKYIPKAIGSILPFLIIAVLLLLPFYDRREDTLKARRLRIIVASVVMAAIILLTLWGEYS